MLKFDDFEAKKTHVQETKEHEPEDEKGFTKPKQLFQNVFSVFHAVLRVTGQDQSMVIPQMKKVPKINKKAPINIIFCVIFVSIYLEFLGSPVIVPPQPRIMMSKRFAE